MANWGDKAVELAEVPTENMQSARTSTADRIAYLERLVDEAHQRLSNQENQLQEQWAILKRVSADLNL